GIAEWMSAYAILDPRHRPTRTVQEPGVGQIAGLDQGAFLGVSPAVLVALLGIGPLHIAPPDGVMAAVALRLPLDALGGRVVHRLAFHEAVLVVTRPVVMGDAPLTQLRAADRPPGRFACLVQAWREHRRQ